MVLKKAIDHYFELAHVVEQTRQQLNPEEYHHLKIEGFLKNPGQELRQLCHFTGMPDQGDYVEACISILYGKPRQSRWKISWPGNLIEQGREQIPKYPCLRGYEFS
ncbi:MAG: hypothetical protein BRD49_03270 [Bacteroidetes bacterium SW_10_40_5]|nr:MAG: hypothetical protein BRD49_03270 [Bacteroidetes bacterium SW_10_40_5]